jgi:uncharacterized membrane protein
MIDLFYELLDKIGFFHPAHPPLTHIPMGLIIGAFFFALIALPFRRSILPPFAYRRIILLALIFTFPTALFGYMDWQHFYEGAWISPIKIKLVATGVLIILLIIAFILGRKVKSETKGILGIYALCLLTVSVLGYYGGQLMFEGEGRPQNVPIKFLIGEKLFGKNCNDCHPRGEGTIGAPQLGDFKTFLALLRTPPKGMPSFSSEQISDQKAMRLYLYLIQLSGQGRK